MAPILLYGRACGVRLKADDDVSRDLQNGRASISLGYIGIHETINALYGNQHMYDSEALREKGVAIVQRLRDAVDCGRKKPATALACTARRAKTCAIASAVSTPPSLAWWKG